MFVQTVSSPAQVSPVSFRGKPRHHPCLSPIDHQDERCGGTMSSRISALVLAVFAISVSGWAQSHVQPRVLQAEWQNPYGQSPAYGQSARLSPDDQQKFDNYYQKWVDASRKNDRDDIEKNARHM